MKTISRLHFLACSFLIIAQVLIFIFVFGGFGKYNHSSGQKALITIAFFVVSGGSLAFYVHSKTKNWRNYDTLERRCVKMAVELKDGKRKWYLNKFPSTNYFFAPLKKTNMNEFAGAVHIPVSKAHLIELMREGKIENPEMARLTIWHFDCLS